MANPTGAFMFGNMADLSIAVNGITYFNGVMHFNIADAANQLTNYSGTSYILTILVASLADTYLGRFTALLLAACIEFFVSSLHLFNSVVGVLESGTKVISSTKICNIKMQH